MYVEQCMLNHVFFVPIHIRMRIVVVLLVIIMTLFNIYLLVLFPVVTVPMPKEPLSLHGPLKSVVENLDAVCPAEARPSFTHMRDSLALCTTILKGVDADRFACIARPLHVSRDKSKLVLLDTGAFAPLSRTGSTLGDAIIQQQAVVFAENPLQRILAEHVHRIKTHAAFILLTVDRTSVGGLKTKRLVRSIVDTVDTYTSTIVEACAKQRIRLKATYPELSHYEFKQENVHSNTTDMPRYHFGSEHAQPIPKTNATSSPTHAFQAYANYMPLSDM